MVLLRTSNAVQFTVLSSQPVTRTGIELRIHDGQNPETLIDILPRARNRQWQEPLGDTGSGSFDISELDPKLVANPELLDYGNLVRCYLDGVHRFTWVIERKKATKVNDAEDGGRLLHVEGRGNLSVLEHALIYPAGGVTGAGTERAFTDEHAGFILRTLVGEAKARGALPAVTTDFTDDADTNSVPLSVPISNAYGVGSDLLALTRQLAELAVDVRMSPVFALEIYETLGVDRTLQTADIAPVILEPAKNIRGLEIESEGLIKNTLLIQAPTGFQERSHATSIGRYSRREAFLAATNAQDLDQITRTADATFRSHALPQDAIAITISDFDAHRPYVDFDLGDYVLSPGPDGALTKYRVRALTVSEDEVGNPIFIPELNTLIKELEERFQRWLKRIGDGTLGGDAANLSSDPVSSTTVSTIDAKIAQHLATSPHFDELSDLLDVDTSGVVDEDVLGFEDASSLWTPRAQAAGAGGSGYPPGSFDVKPVAPHVKDDEFDGSSAVVWTSTPTAPTAWDIDTTREDHAYLKAAGVGSTIVGKYQAIPATPFTVVAKLAGTTHRSNYHRGGEILLIQNGAVGAGSAMVGVGAVYVDAYRVHREYRTNFATWNNDVNVDIRAPLTPLYFKVIVNAAANGIDCYWSPDGWAWRPVQVGYGVPFTIGYVGLGCNEESAGGGVETFWDFIRFS
jgi:hypothetical protein